MLANFDERMKDILKDEYHDFIESLSKPPIKGIYFNFNKTVDPDLIKEFELIPHHYTEGGYIFDYEKYPLGKYSYFDAGLYYIQEPSAMIVASLVDLQEGDKILDMCAAPGGKTCYVASKLHQTGLVIANDIDAKRASILSSNVERFGLTNTIVTNVSCDKLEAKFPDYFDHIILDAPCSGEGMFRKLDQAISTWSIDKVNECASIQKKLIEEAYNMLKPGGTLIYSTCTYEIAENEDTIRSLLENHPDMHLVEIPKQNGMAEGIDMKEAVRLYPHKHLGEGHFIAKLIKDEKEVYDSIKMTKANIKKADLKLVQEFYRNYLNISCPLDLYDHNGHIYSIHHFPDLSHLKVLRMGLYLGEIKKNRFEPSYALAKTLEKKNVKQYYSYHYNEKPILDYLKGETIEGTSQKGYGVLFVDDYPLSFYKESNHQAKNLFPKGLRKQY